MASAGATLQNYNNDLVRCARHTLAHTLQNRHRCCATVEPNSSVTRCLPVRAGIEELREKREELNRSVAADEEEKGASVAHTFTDSAALAATRLRRG